MKIFIITQLMIAIINSVVYGMGIGTEEHPKAPPVTAFQLPTFSGEAIDYNSLPAIDSPDPRLDFDTVFSVITGCYPVPSKFSLDIEARIVANTADIINLDSSSQGQYYGQIVARMPLYSTSEIDRVTQFEARQRDSIAKDVGDFFKALSHSRLAHRQLGLYSSLESRSQARVQLGLADTTEQVSYLDKVIEAQKDVSSTDAEINSLRVRLVSYCRDSERDRINLYLVQMQKYGGVKK